MIVSALIAAGLLLAGPGEALACLNADKVPSQLTARAAKRATICSINRARLQRGVPKLKPNRRLARAARRHSRAMNRDNYFSHTSLGGATLVTRILRTGYLKGSLNWGLGENLRWGSGEAGTPRAAVKSWLQSPAHRITLLSRRYKHLGVGVALGSPTGALEGDSAIYTADFGYR